MFETYWETEKDKAIDAKAGRMVAWCLSVFLGLIVVVCLTAALL